MEMELEQFLHKRRSKAYSIREKKKNKGWEKYFKKYGVHR
jgi:hypothetical protein